MSYEKQTFEHGQVLKHTDLNSMSEHIDGLYNELFYNYAEPICDIPVEMELTVGKYVSPDSTIKSSSAGYAHSNVIALKAGEFIRVTASGNGYTPIATCDVSGENIVAQIVETGNSTIREKNYYYTAEEDTYVIVSLKSTENYEVYKGNKYASNYSSKINARSLTKIKAKLSDIVSTTRNYILKEKVEGGIKYFYYSKDCGITWTKSENNFGDIQFIHWFSTGVCLVCTVNSVYTTTDFKTFTSTTVYDVDGTEYTPTVRTFFRLGSYNHPYLEVNGKECAVWNDYGNQSEYKSRVWFTDDYGKTLRCILRNGDNDSNGTPIATSHFHRTFLDSKGQIWVTSGDYDNTLLIKGVLENGEWKWDILAQGTAWKWGQLTIREPYAYLITDYTDGTRDTGLICVPISTIDDESTFQYLYKTSDKAPLSSYFEDDAGNKLIGPDGLGRNRIWYAKNDVNFKELFIDMDGYDYTPMNIIGPNYNGDVICLGFNGMSDNATACLNLQGKRFSLTDAFRNAGVVDFGAVNKSFL